MNDPHEPQYSAFDMARQMGQATTTIVNLFEAKITTHTVEQLAKRGIDAVPDLMFTHPQDLEEFSRLAVIASAAKMVGDKPAFRAALLAMGLPQHAESLGESIEGHGRLEHATRDLPAAAGDLGVTLRRLVTGEHHGTIEVPEFPPDDAA